MKQEVLGLLNLFLSFEIDQCYYLGRLKIWNTFGYIFLSGGFYFIGLQ